MGKEERGTVLIVDDEFAIAETLKDLLEDEGFRVLLASNGQEALKVIAAGGLDVVITDVMMPVMNGIELVQALRANEATRSLPVIMMSSATRAAALQGSIANDAISAFLRKPFDLNSLMVTVEQLVDAKPSI